MNHRTSSPYLTRIDITFATQERSAATQSARAFLIKSQGSRLRVYISCSDVNKSSVFYSHFNNRKTTFTVQLEGVIIQIVRIYRFIKLSSTYSSPLCIAQSSYSLLLRLTQRLWEALRTHSQQQMTTHSQN